MSLSKVSALFKVPSVSPFRSGASIRSFAAQSQSGAHSTGTQTQTSGAQSQPTGAQSQTSSGTQSQSSGAKSQEGVQVTNSSNAESNKGRELDRNSNRDFRRNRGLRRRNDWDDSLSPFNAGFGLNRWDPFRDFDRMERSLMNDFYGGRVPSRQLDTFEWRPTADMIATKDGYEITAEIPGVTKDNIKVDINDDVITLRGEKKMESKHGEEGSDSYYKERSFGSFTRKFALPDGVDPKSIKASFKDGVLKMHLPKTNAQQSTHEINIE